MTTNRIAELIESTSERLCRDHYDMSPMDIFCHGGPDHNDDRLRAKVMTDGDEEYVRVSDGNHEENYEGSADPESVRAFVEDWLGNIWDSLPLDEESRT